MEIFLSLVFVLVGFIVLIYGAKYMIDGASSIANSLQIPAIVIGLTVVAFGTSAPELAINIFSSLEHKSDMVMGNILGSNIFNVCMILGISAIVRPIIVSRNTHWLEFPFNILAILVLAVLSLDVFFNSSDTNSISTSDGIILLLFFIIFMVYNIQLAKSGNESEEVDIKNISLLTAVLFLIGGIIGLVIGGRLIVMGATDIAKAIGMSDRVIGLTVLAVGTSLPELAASVVAVKKGNTDLALGNVVGSNLFNIFQVLGISSIIYPISISDNVFKDIYINIALSIFLFLVVFVGKGKRINHWEGWLLVFFYIGYTFYLIVNPG